jgi:hypothetical protein
MSAHGIRSSARWPGGYELLEYMCENNRDYVAENGVTRMRLQSK